MRNIVIVVFCFLLSSCAKSLNDIIDGGDYKYWYFTIPHCSQPWFYYFDETGYWTIFNLYIDGTFKKHDFGDILTDDKWNLHGDSILQFNGSNYRILKAEDSVLILKNHSKIDTLRAATQKMIPKQFMCKQSSKNL